jgi:TetR/AcrR family transcriptional repressor of nem operon
MGRHKEFSVEQALDRALHVFWSKGFEGASLSDLTEEMGIQRASLYATYGNKESLYEKALIEYQARGLQALDQKLSGGDDPLEILRSALQTAIPSSLVESNGCFCLNASIDRAPHDPDIRRLLHDHFNKVETALAKVVAKGIAAERFRLDLSPSAAGKYLLVVLNGLHAAAKTEPDHRRLHDTIELALSSLLP